MKIKSVFLLLVLSFSRYIFSVNQVESKKVSEDIEFDENQFCDNSKSPEEAAEFFKKCNLPFDIDFVKKYPFGVKPIVILENCFTRIIEKCYLDADLCEEYWGLQYKKLFHYALVHLCDLYALKARLSDLMRIDEVVEAHFIKTIKSKKNDQKALENDLEQLFKNIEIRH